MRPSAASAHPFELLEVVGRGGMGVVWRARHRADGAEVALKLLVGEGVDADALHREVEAMAVLAHPHIVAIYDVGRLPEAGVSRPEAPPGAPYFAMELLTGGSLHEHGGTLHWTGTRHVLLAMLDALGHAHARRVLHLDLKPANVLRDADGDWRLVDFGIARALWEPGKTVGTPSFMAPEQLRGDRAAVGPHTDLFALGTLAWTLVTGRPPRDGAPGDILSQALAGTPGVFEPRFRVPEGLEPWLRALMEPDPRDRVAVAADAAHALASMPEFAARVEGVAAVPAPEVSSTFTLDAITTALTPLDGAVPPAAHATATLAPPPLPETWEEPERSRSLPSSLGLGLFGLRPMPFAGRRAERDALFAALREVHAGARRWVHLAGPSGLGRTRLGQWLCERASELGAATVYAPGPGVEGLRAALLAHGGVPEARALARWLAEPVEGARVRALQAWLAGGAAPGAVVAEQLFAELLAACSAERPALLWLDDVDERGLRLIGHLREGRVLALTAAPEELAGPEACVHLEPLADTDLRALLLHLLGVRESLAHELSERAGGSPRFVHQVLSLLVERGSLLPTPEGYDLPEGLPLDAQVDADGLESWLHTEADRDAVELAAVLGPRVHTATWEAALAEAELSPSPDLLERGRRLGWIRRTREGWAFADAIAHARLARSPRAARWHRTAVGVLGEDEPGRIAAHLLALGDPEAAIPHLRRRAMRANEEGDLAGARRQYRRVGRLMLDAGDRAGHAEMVGWEAWMSYQLGDLDEGRRLADDVISVGTRLGNAMLVASGAHTKGVIEGSLATAAAQPLLRRAARLYREHGDEHLAVQAEGSAWSAAPPTEAGLAALRALAEGQDSEVIRAMVERNLAEALLRAGRDGEALAVATAAHARFEASRVIQGLSAIAVQIGHAHIGLGDIDAADAAYLRGFRALVDHSGGRHVEVTLFLGLARLLRREWRDASRLIRRSARRLETYRWAELTTAARFGQLALLAWEGEGDRFDLVLLEALAHAQRLAFPPELALEPFLALAAEVWEEQGRPERAAGAREAMAELPARAVRQ